MPEDAIPAWELAVRQAEALADEAGLPGIAASEAAGLLERAIAIFEEVLPIHPDEGEVRLHRILLMLCRAELELEGLTDGLTWCDHAMAEADLARKVFVPAEFHRFRATILEMVVRLHHERGEDITQDLAAARTELRRSLRSDPGNPSTIAIRARLNAEAASASRKRARQFLKAAVADFESVLPDPEVGPSHLPEFGTALVILGDQVLGAGEDAEPIARRARHILARAIKFEPGQARLLGQLGNAWILQAKVEVRKGRSGKRSFQRAMKAFREALASGQDAGRIHFAMGSGMLARLEQVSEKKRLAILDEAIAHFDAAMAEAPSPLEYRLLRAEAHLQRALSRQENPSEAKRDFASASLAFEQLLRESPRNLQARRGRGTALVKQAQDLFAAGGDAKLLAEQAVGDLDLVLAGGVADCGTLFLRGSAHYLCAMSAPGNAYGARRTSFMRALRDLERSGKAFRGADLSIDLFLKVLSELASLEKVMGLDVRMLVKRELHELDRLGRRRGRDAAYWIRRCRLLRKLGHVAAAGRAVRMALRLAPRDAEAAWLLDQLAGE